MIPKRNLLLLTVIISLTTAVSFAQTATVQVKSSVSKKTQDTSNSKIIVTFVELGSVNCVPCRMMQPVMKEVEEKYSSQVRVIFHDVWTPDGKPYGAKYGIRSIPTQIFLDKDGTEYFRHEGFFPKEKLVKILAMKGVEL
jgi:thioredoxin 1